jgi:hypothetical protein
MALRVVRSRSIRLLSDYSNALAYSCTIKFSPDYLTSMTTTGKPDSLATTGRVSFYKEPGHMHLNDTPTRLF